MFRRRRHPKDFQEEIHAHLQWEAERLQQEEGLSEAEALAAARRAFGNVTQAEERFYRSGSWFRSDLFQDLRFGVRMLAKNPGSTTVAVLTLALGIGANTAIFSLLHAVLLRSLPVEKPQQLVLFGEGTWMGSQDTLPDRSWQLFSYPFYREFRKGNRVFSDVAAIDSIIFGSHGRIGRGADFEKMNVELVSGSYFGTLGVSPVLGRALTEKDDQTPGAHPVAVASYSWWQRRFGRNPQAVGSAVTINSTIYTVIGVAPPGFFGVTVGQSPDLWIPLAMEREISPGWNGLEQNLFQSLYLIARRKPGISMEKASANTNLLFKQVLRQYAGPKPSPKDLASIEHARIELNSAATGLSQIRLQFASPLKILMAVAALVLLIACANVANLLLARGASRRREIAVRMSLGAGRSRLIRQLLLESGLLGLLGGVFGALLAWGTSGLLLATASQPIPIRVTPDVEVLGFTLLAASLTVFLFGTAPALYATRLSLAPSLKEGRGVLGATAHNRLSRGLIVGQVALSLALLAGAGLFLQSLKNLLGTNTGFDQGHVLVMHVDPTATGYRLDARLERTMQEVEQQVGSLRGVSKASFAFSLFGGGWTNPVTVPGRPKSDADPDVFQNIVGPDYLNVMRTPVVLGRGLSWRDHAASQKVAVINESMARAYFPGGSPIGRTFSVGDNPEWQNIEVVGVAGDAKYMSLKQDSMPAAFYPHAQHGMFLYNLVARCVGDPKAVVPEIREAVRAIDSQLPVDDATTLQQMIEDSVLNQRLMAQLSTIFGLLAAFLCCVGIYGVVSYGVTRRTSEFGIRMALGAQRTDVLWAVVREALRMVLTGSVLGLLLTLACGRLVQSQLFGLESYDPLALCVALVVMIAVSLGASYLPARRATRIDPIAALRYE